MRIAVAHTATLTPRYSTPTSQQGAPGFNVPPPAAPPDIKSPEDFDAWTKKMNLKPGSPVILPSGEPGYVH